jgi:hypothetical protein
MPTGKRRASLGNDLSDIAALVPGRRQCSVTAGQGDRRDEPVRQTPPNI